MGSSTLLFLFHSVPRFQYNPLYLCNSRCVAFFANAGGRHPFHGDPFAVVAGQHDLSTLQDQVDCNNN
jgi:hypothetical protein